MSNLSLSSNHPLLANSPSLYTRHDVPQYARSLWPVWVHGLYRTTGANFEKAQQEFATGVMSNKTVQTVAANAASTAATSRAQNVFKGNRM
ncbi:secretory carrier-associated membrane protein 1-like protein [Pitangus sulphuratus]|nr:secretory carrier-associated membrane protein 1-like protein [Pitangus sulphuratus]